MEPRDYYSDLEINQSDGQEAIQQAYRRLAKRYHPDRAGLEGAGRFRLIQEAYEVLSDPRRKAAYDETISSRRVRRPRPAEPLVTPSARTRPEPFAAPDAPTNGSSSAGFSGLVRPEVYEFARVAERLLSPALLNGQLTEDEHYVVRFYVGQLLERFGG
jgi:curved DNA-binding protein CbpA